MKLRVIGLFFVVTIIFAACGQDQKVNPGTDFTGMAENAKGTSVRFYMWGGDVRINSWIDTYLAGALEIRHGIALTRIPEDAEIFVNKLIVEKQAGRDKGSIDLLWINGENFRNARSAEILYGPFTDQLPNFRNFIDPSTVTHDFGFPVDGYEAPYGRAQFVFEYDSQRVITPPESFAQLAEWVRAHPGRFTYPQPPSFTGSAFIRQAFYAVTGGHDQYMNGFDSSLFAEKAPLLWQYLNELEPFLWEKGKTYPKEKSALDLLFTRGEVDFNMSYHQADAFGRILSGQYPDTVRTFVMTDGSLFNTHFTAIPFNAPNIAGAVVTANLLLDPEVQYAKNDPEQWGDFTVLDMSKLSAEIKSRFESLDLGEATVPFSELEKYAVPEIPSDYLDVLERGWEEHVLRN
jgi:putative spermidine/putrescine transport system substrate-binding protein